MTILQVHTAFQLISTRFIPPLLGKIQWLLWLIVHIHRNVAPIHSHYSDVIMGMMTSQITDEFLAQMASNAENVSIWWRILCYTTHRERSPHTQWLSITCEYVFITSDNDHFNGNILRGHCILTWTLSSELHSICLHVYICINIIYGIYAYMYDMYA